MRRLILAAATLFVAAAARPALAANAGITTNVDSNGSIFSFTINQAPGVSWTITTSNLSAGSDTVINVQNFDDVQGGYVAGNDDFNGLASQVVVPPAPNNASRNLLVLVRSYSAVTHGTCDVTAVPSSGTSMSYPGTSFAGGDMVLIGDLPVAGHVATLPRSGGDALRADDTLLLVGTGLASHVIAFDDDDGTWRSSFVHINEACPSCWVVVANYSDTRLLKTDLLWDANPDTDDADSDGLSNSLETALGTDLANRDTDQDGLTDSEEVMGSENSSEVLNFRMWGADPKQKDLFIEVDWVTCTTPGCGMDDNQYSSSNVPFLKADYAPSGGAPVRIHMDIGVNNTGTDPATWGDWGNWGGAARTDSATDACQGLSSLRTGRFHHFMSNGGGSSNVPSPCAWIGNSGITASHELGHGLGLLHGGRPVKFAMNAKPNYLSRMNYAYQNVAPSFSRGNFPLPTMNPTLLSEAKGACTQDTNVLNSINGWCRGATCTKDLGLTCNGSPVLSVDWNRDGVFSTTGTVRGGLTMGWGIDGSHYARSDFDQNTLNDASMTWVSVGGTVGDRLFLFGRRTSDGLMQFTSTARTSLTNSCNTMTSLDEWTQNCAGFTSGTPTNFPTGKTAIWGAGVAEMSGKILVVRQPTSLTQHLTSNLLTINSSTGAVSFGADVVLPGNFDALGDVTALSTATGVVTAWAVTSSNLKQWTYQNGAWSQPVNQLWADGTAINPQYGIGATRGYDSTGVLMTFAAIATKPSGLVEFARQETNGRWTKLATWTGTGSVGEQPKVRARPGLAYQATAGQPFSVGRFYMALNLPSNCSSLGPYFNFGNNGNCEAKLIMTEGNKATNAADRRLIWITPSYSFGPNPGVSDPNSPSFALGGISLVSDMSRDTNLRGLKTFPWGSTTFTPLADGIVSANLSDLDDYQYIRADLRWSLGLEGPPLP